PDRFAKRYALSMRKNALRRSELILTVSEASRADILSFYPEADPERLQVVPNAIDEAILEDPGEEEMERVRERYQIRRRFVLYAGNIKPHKNLARLITGFGLPPLEAMACGTPVVTSRISSLPEVVGDAALLVDPYSVDDIASALERVLGDDALRGSLVARGRARVQDFSWERSARAIHAGYMKVLGVTVPAVAAPEEAR